MRLSERHLLPVPLDHAWAALNDLPVLRHALPGCETLLEIAPDEFVAEMAIPLGLATPHCTVYVHRRDIQAPRACTLHFETRTPGAGAGGTGSAALRLTPAGDGATTLQVDLVVIVDGLVAQLGGALIDIAARQMATLFFDRLREGAIARHAGAPMA
jgi:carbon monoxide dehydrogenase subunit G